MFLNHSLKADLLRKSTLLSGIRTPPRVPCCAKSVSWHIYLFSWVLGQTFVVLQGLTALFDSFVYLSELPPMGSFPAVPWLSQYPALLRFRVYTLLLIFLLSGLPTLLYQSYLRWGNYSSSHLQLLSFILVKSRSSYASPLLALWIPSARLYSWNRTEILWLHHPFYLSSSCTVTQENWGLQLRDLSSLNTLFVSSSRAL